MFSVKFTCTSKPTNIHTPEQLADFMLVPVNIPTGTLYIGAVEWLANLPQLAEAHYDHRHWMVIMSLRPILHYFQHLRTLVISALLLSNEDVFVVCLYSFLGINKHAAIWNDT